MVKKTRGILENAEPMNWQEHLFGLPLRRWQLFKGRSYLVTGAGTGYGRSISVALAAAGARVYLLGRREEKLIETLREAESFKISTDACQKIAVDLNRSEDIQRTCEFLSEGFPVDYGVVHCAALPQKSGNPSPLQQDSLESWSQMIQTNLTGPWLLTREIISRMSAALSARIIFLTSEAGWNFTNGFGPYNISKAALNNLSGSLAEEVAASFPGKDIQINTLSPGEAKTEMNIQSTISPYSVVSMVLILLSHQAGGPNGKFFHRDGRHLEFNAARSFERSLL